jgi:hypothetical protein
MNGCCNLSRQGFGPSRRAKSGSTADTAAGGPRGGVTVTILNADKRTGTHVFTTVACAGRVTTICASSFCNADRCAQHVDVISLIA